MAMLEFCTVNVPNQLQAFWIEICSTVQRILTKNPSILNYWVRIRRDSLYRRLSRYKIKNVDDIWIKLLAKTDDISANDIDQIYQYIQTSVHILITDIYCTSSYYAQTKQNEGDEKTITITLSGRLFVSNHPSFVFVASAVLLRELTRAIYPKCLIEENAKRYVKNSLFFSWTGIPLYLWPYHLRRQKVDSSRPSLFKRYYRANPCDGIWNLVSDVGNLFQHVFYNGEVHLYDEFDERCEQVITDALIKTHDSRSARCSARYLNDQFFNDFFNVHQCSLETVRSINDQICPYYPYGMPSNQHRSRIYFLVVTDTPITKKWSWTHGRYSECRGPCYKYKPYHFHEPRQFYEQIYFAGHPLREYYPKCGQLYPHVIPTNDPFFVENRSLFRLGDSLPKDDLWVDVEVKDELLVLRPPKYDNNDLEEEPEQTIEKHTNHGYEWYLWISRIRDLIISKINQIIKHNTRKSH